MNPIPSDPFWHRPPVPVFYLGWLRDETSLTDRIRSRCSAFSVKVVFQGLRRADRDERFLLRDADRRRMLVREVLLYCRRTPVVFAHSVLDPDDLRGPWRRLAGLGNRPLGAALFADPLVRRHPLRQKKLHAHHELHRRARATLSTGPGPLWARRSLFTLHESPILVTEVFLPGILKLGK
ncbi:MAG: chorismate lyase [Burkholderiales bacterium]|nr:chorismate lyase [Burkholderiales bacterium]